LRLPRCGGQRGADGVPADWLALLVRWRLPDIPQNAAELSGGALREGQVFWATIDSPWMHVVDRGKLDCELDAIAKLEPSMILSSHLPPAPGGMIDQFLASLAAVPDAGAFVGPDQVAIEQMLAQMTAGPR
jgi:hypothetical protein